jgi:hypothetical protein
MRPKGAPLAKIEEPLPRWTADGAAAATRTALPVSRFPPSDPIREGAPSRHLAVRLLPM